jgi:hypothetical protein
VDRLPEISQPPHILSDYTSALQKGNFKAEIDNFLKTRAPAFLHNLRARLLLSAAEAAQSGTHYNVPMINALVMYVGTQAILQNSRPGGKSGAPTIARSAPMEIFLFLARELDPEVRTPAPTLARSLARLAFSYSISRILFILIAVILLHLLPPAPACAVGSAEAADRAATSS